MVLTVDQVVRHKGIIFGDPVNEQYVYEFNSKVTGELIGYAMKYVISSRVYYKIVYCGQLKFVSTLVAARKWLVDAYNTRMATLEQGPALEQGPEKEQTCPKVELMSHDLSYRIRYEAVLNGHRQYLGSYFKDTKAFVSSVLDIVREDTCEKESQVMLEKIIRFANSVSEGLL